MSTYTLNYAFWTGLVGAALEYFKRRGYVKLSTVALNGFTEKALLGLISSYMQAQGLPLIGSGLDANYIYNGLVGALTSSMVHNKGSLQGAEEQILCALIGHRFASNWSQAFDSITVNFPGINSMFSGSSGYQGADVPSQGVPIPSTNSGNNYTDTNYTATGGNFTNNTMPM